MHHFYYSCLHWGIFASLGKLYLYRCTHSWMNPLFFWVCVQHVALQRGKTKQGTRSMEGKTCFTPVLLLQKTTQNFPDLWDQLYFLRPQQEFKGQWSPWKEILAGWALGFQLLEAERLVNCVRGSEPDLSAGQRLGRVSPWTAEGLGFKHQLRSFICSFTSVLCFFSWVHAILPSGTHS